jgi:hypothetical protein
VRQQVSVVLCAIEIDDRRVDVASTTRASVGGNSSETIGVAPDEEEMIAAVGPQMNAGLSNSGGSAEDENAPGLGARSL